MADLTPEQLAELRRRADGARDAWWAPSLSADESLYLAALSPDVVLSLLDRLEAAEARQQATADLLHQLATARREYMAEPCPEPERSLLQHEARTLDNVAAVFDGDDTWADSSGSVDGSSWRWPEFGEHDPSPSCRIVPAEAVPGAVAGEPGSEVPGV